MVFQGYRVTFSNEGGHVSSVQCLVIHAYSIPVSKNSIFCYSCTLISTVPFSKHFTKCLVFKYALRIDCFLLAYIIVFLVDCHR